MEVLCDFLEIFQSQIKFVLGIQIRIREKENGSDIFGEESFHAGGSTRTTAAME